MRLRTHTGLSLDVRPVRDHDEQLLAEFFKHLTPQDLRFRFLGGVQEVSHERLVSMTHVDHRRTENFLVFAEGGKALVASAMLARNPSGAEAEVAIAVHADYRHKGVAWELLRYVANYAQANGIMTLQSIESRENHEAIELEREQGFVAKPFPEDPTLVLIQKELRPSKSIRG
ncbi:GNAT family N-acetyltransferase [Rhizobium binae]|nr:GNAT family N-acetyltransferase [Rhizobium binae]MBX4944959.1 GNAT family N-acetyltransferase [Rhizobium binae]MBX4980262.1 GNAT family N-acetyltransferase [Rhizobium binae]